MQRTRRLGRVRGGKKVHEFTPQGNWKILTVLGAMRLGGRIATMTVVAATNAEIFLAYLDCSSAVSANRATWSSWTLSVRTGLQACANGSRLWAPRASTCNLARQTSTRWKKLKQTQRASELGQARTVPALDAAITQLLPEITPKTHRHGSDSRFQTTSNDLIRAKCLE